MLEEASYKAHTCFGISPSGKTKKLSSEGENFFDSASHEPNSFLVTWNAFVSLPPVDTLTVEPTSIV